MRFKLAVLVVALSILVQVSIASAAKEESIKQCIAAKDQELFSLAVTTCSQVLAEEPNHVDALFWRGYARLNMVELELAISDFSRILQVQPSDTQAWVHRSIAYRWSYNFSQALADANRALELDPKYEEAYVAKGTALFGLKQGSEALDAYGIAIDLNPKLYRAYLGRAFVFEKQNNPEQSKNEALRTIGVCKIVCASVLSHRELGTMGKKGRESTWRIRTVNAYSARSNSGT